MEFFFRSGVKIIEKYVKRERVRSTGDLPVRLILFSLGSRFEENFLVRVIEFAQELDKLTGPYCLAVAFAPAPSIEDLTRYSQENISLVTRKIRYNTESWRRYIDETTSNTTELARFLALEDSDFPCFTFIDTANPTECAIVRLRGSDLNSEFRKLRQLYFKWYSDNAPLFDTLEFLTLYGNSGFNLSSVNLAGLTILHDQLRSKVIPIVETAIREHVRCMDGHDEIVNQIFHSLRQNPTDTQPLKKWLANAPMGLVINGRHADAKSFDKVYRWLFSSNVMSQSDAKKRLHHLKSNFPDFPLSRVLDVFGEATIRNISGHVGNPTMVSATIDSLLFGKNDHNVTLGSRTSEVADLVRKRNSNLDTTFTHPAPDATTPSENEHRQALVDLVNLEVLPLEENKNNLRQLIEQIKWNPKNIVPFVGAGVSLAYGFPLWRDFLLDQARFARLVPEINARLDDGQFEEAAEELQTARRATAFNDAFNNAFGTHILEGKTLSGCAVELRRLSSGAVITTNYDRVLEIAFEQGNEPFVEKVWGARAGVATDALNKGERILLKLHGDCRDPGDRVLTRSDYERTYGNPDGSALDLSKPVPRLLRQILTGRSLLFVGCSLSADRTLSVIQHVATEFAETRHYAIVELPERDDDIVARSQFFADHNIRPIWYPCRRHDLVEAILRYIADVAIPPPAVPRGIHKPIERIDRFEADSSDDSGGALMLWLDNTDKSGHSHEVVPLEKEKIKPGLKPFEAVLFLHVQNRRNRPLKIKNAGIMESDGTLITALAMNGVMPYRPKVYNGTQSDFAPYDTHTIIEPDEEVVYGFDLPLTYHQRAHPQTILGFIDCPDRILSDKFVWVSLEPLDPSPILGNESADSSINTLFYDGVLWEFTGDARDRILRPSPFCGSCRSRMNVVNQTQSHITWACIRPNCRTQYSWNIAEHGSPQEAIADMFTAEAKKIGRYPHVNPWPFA